MSRSWLLAVALAAACLTAPYPAVAGTHRVPPMVQKLNDARRAHGLASLHYSPALGRSATGYARYLIRHHRFAHPTRYRIRAHFARIGEVLAMLRGSRPRRGAAVRKWLRSPVHRTIILSKHFTYVGAGRATGRFGGRTITIWVVHVGRK